jgi:hypothetical protein
MTPRGLRLQEGAESELARRHGVRLKLARRPSEVPPRWRWHVTTESLARGGRSKSYREKKLRPFLQSTRKGQRQICWPSALLQLHDHPVPPDDLSAREDTLMDVAPLLAQTAEIGGL